VLLKVGVIQSAAQYDSFLDSLMRAFKLACIQRGSVVKKPGTACGSME
jgi:hypothetical protein